MMFMSVDLIRLIIQRFKRKIFRARNIFYSYSCKCLDYVYSKIIFFYFNTTFTFYRILFVKKNYNFKNRL